MFNCRASVHADCCRFMTKSSATVQRCNYPVSKARLDVLLCHRSDRLIKDKNSKGSPPAAARLKQKQEPSAAGFGAKRPEQLWRCVEGCGACCKLAKESSFATPEEIFTDSSDIELYRTLIGPDGWCIHYDKGTRKCSIYPDRPYFCRVEADVFLSLYGIPKKKFNKEACNCCRDTIKSVYGPHSKELDKFNRAIDDSIST